MDTLSRMTNKEFVGYMAMGYLLSILITTISSMAIHETMTETTSSYKNGVKVVSAVSIVAAVSVLIAAPVMSIKDKKMLRVYLLIVLLSALVGTLAAISLDSTNKTNDDNTYKTSVKTISGVSLGLAAFVLMFTTSLMVTNKRALAVFALVVTVAILITAIAGMAIHLAVADSAYITEAYKDTTKTVSSIGIIGAVSTMVAIPVLARQKGVL